MTPPPEEVQDFVNARGRPAVFLVLPNQSIELTHAMQLRTLLADRQFEELDVVIHSGGGDIHAAYLIAELLRSHTTGTLTACVPLYAKSAATLICIAADSIVLDEIAQLGPLDTQILREEKGGKREFQSALNPFKTLAELKRIALDTLDDAVKLIGPRSGLVVGESLEHAIHFVQVTVGSLFNPNSADKLGDSSRALSIGIEYGYRLLSRLGKQTAIVDKLVYGYPSHDYVIDHHELKQIGLDTRCFDQEEQRAVQHFFKLIGDEIQIIGCFDPTSPKHGEQARQRDTAEVTRKRQTHGSRGRAAVRAGSAGNGEPA